MKAHFAVFLCVTLLALAGCSDRVNDSPSGHSASMSYPELQQNEIRGLTPEQVTGLRNGEGMGYALPAELNGYPGPKHVLELARELGLNTSQHEATSTVREGMLQEAKATGEELIAAYQALDEEFRAQAINETRLREQAQIIGSLEGELRSIHMAAHLKMMDILTHEQVMQYAELRGYAHSGHTVHDH